MSNVARAEVPTRMRSITVRMKIDDRRVLAIVDYDVSSTGINPMAVWIKVRPTESTLDRELRASGKMTSLLLQYGCTYFFSYYFRYFGYTPAGARGSCSGCTIASKFLLWVYKHCANT